MKDIAIVGGGLVGSLLSIFMAKRGHKVSVYEKRHDIRGGELGAGRSINLALSHRGWRALEEVGLATQIREKSIPMKGRFIHNQDGSTAFQAYGQEGQAIYSVSRGELNAELDRKSSSYDNVNYHYETPCTNIDLKTGQLRFKRNGESLEVKPGVVFGADGAFSRVRGALQKSGRFNYSQSYLEHGYKELSIPPTADGGWKIEKNALHIWPRESFMLIALPNLDGSFTCTLFLNYMGAVSFDALQTEESVEAFFKKYFPDVIPVMPDFVSDFFENPTSSLITIKCSPWHYGDNVLLLGDASHAIVPFYGQGMNSGFEDCFLFDEALGAASAKGEVNWSSLLSSFSASRKPDADAISDLALYNFIEMRDLVGDPRFLLRKKIEKRLQKQFPNKFQSAYEMVTFSNEPYSKAWAMLKRQNLLFEEILAIPGIANDWDSGSLDPEMSKLIGRHLLT